MDPIFSITTPIYYVNDEPHIGHAYTTILADVLARYPPPARAARPSSSPAPTSTGRRCSSAAAQRRGRPAGLRRRDGRRASSQPGRRLDITNDDFIRTTEPRHVRVVQQRPAGPVRARRDLPRRVRGLVLRARRALLDREGPASTACCPDCGRPVEQHRGDELLLPHERVPGLAGGVHPDPPGLHPARPTGATRCWASCASRWATCASRARPARLSWGIPLPFDPDYVTYVWFDALLNYVTAAGYLARRGALRAPVAAGPAPDRQGHPHHPQRLLADHAQGRRPAAAQDHLRPRLVGGRRDARCASRWATWSSPLDLAERYGVDAFRYFLMREMALGQDADFTEQRLAARYQADLANNLGNLLHRVVNMIGRYCGGCVPEPNGGSLAEAALRERVEALPGASSTWWTNSPSTRRWRR